MKTAISLPDELFVRADRVAKQANVSRSDLDPRALERFLDDIDGDGITAKLDDVYRSASSLLDPVLIVSADRFNRSAINTVVGVVVTSNLRLGDAPGNVTLASG